jgi:hypothetical protein
MSCHGSWFSSIQMSLGQRRHTSSKHGDAPDCRRSRQNQTIQFVKSDSLVFAVLSRSFRFLSGSCRNTFWRLCWKSTTSSMSTMKGENSSNNGSDLDKGNILKPTFNTLTEEGHKVFEAYRAYLEEVFLSCCEVRCQGTVLWDTTPIVFNKPEVIPEVWSHPSPSRNDIEAIINYAIERQTESIDELLHRLIEEWDGKIFDATSVNPSSSTCAVSFTQTNPHTSGASAVGTSVPIPSAQPVNYFHSQTTIEGSAPTYGMPHQTTSSMFEQGYMHTTPTLSMPNFTLAVCTRRGNG